MIAFVSFIGASVGSFAFRHLEGDRKRSTFMLNLFALLFSVTVLACSDHLLLFLAFWIASNVCISRLMLHKNEWPAARASADLALKYHLAGSTLLACAFALSFILTGETSINLLLQSPIAPIWQSIISLMLLLAAMMQSGLWPFHRWLISSLNAPTPASALMHAGVVNAGGFLLIRFSPLLLQSTLVLSIILISGMVSVLLGTFWKLMQHDVKRMLACSTMAQMGFMIAECGLGLFSLALSHLCWHGVFKAYLFLSSNAAAQEKRYDLNHVTSIRQWPSALLAGCCGAYTFSLVSFQPILASDTTLFLAVITTITGTQLALTLPQHNPIRQFSIACLSTLAMGIMYGLSMRMIDVMVADLALSQPQPINLLHHISLVVITLSWLVAQLGKNLMSNNPPTWYLKAYVYMLNASQPHPHTVTTHRNHYQY